MERDTITNDSRTRRSFISTVYTRALQRRSHRRTMQRDNVQGLFALLTKLITNDGRTPSVFLFCSEYIGGFLLYLNIKSKIKLPSIKRLDANESIMIRLLRVARIKMCSNF